MHVDFGKKGLLKSPGWMRNGDFGQGMTQNYSMNEFPIALLGESHKDSQLLHDYMCN